MSRSGLPNMGTECGRAIARLQRSNAVHACTCRFRNVKAHHANLPCYQKKDAVFRLAIVGSSHKQSRTEFKRCCARRNRVLIAKAVVSFAMLHNLPRLTDASILGGLTFGNLRPSIMSALKCKFALLKALDRYLHDMTSQKSSLKSKNES